MKTKSEDSSKIELNFPSEKDTNQTREIGMFKKSSDFDNLDKQNPFAGMESNPCGGHATGKGR